MIQHSPHSPGEQHQTPWTPGLVWREKYTTLWPAGPLWSCTHPVWLLVSWKHTLDFIVCTRVKATTKCNSCCGNKWSQELKVPFWHWNCWRTMHCRGIRRNWFSSSPEQTGLLPLADGGVGFKDVRPLSFLTSCHGSSSCHAYWPWEKKKEQAHALHRQSLEWTADCTYN